MVKLGELSNIGKRTLLRLKEQLAQYSFTIHHIEGPKNPVDYHSRNALSLKEYEQSLKNATKSPLLPDTKISNAPTINNATKEECTFREEKKSLCAVHLTDEKLSNANDPDQGPWISRLDLIKSFQKTDPFILRLRNFLLNNTLPTSTIQKKLILKYGKDCFLKNDIVFITLERDGYPKADLIVAPGKVQAALIAEAHSSKLFGHDKASKTLERLLSAWYWPGIASDTTSFVEECEICRRNRKKSTSNSALLKHSEYPNAPLLAVNTDLFGPLVARDGTKKFILTIVDQFSKHAEFVIVPNKSAEQIAQGIFSRWI